MSEFSEEARRLSGKIAKIGEATLKRNREILNEKQKTKTANFHGKQGRPRKTHFQQCYKPFGKCQSQIICWGTIYCTSEKPDCIGEI